ncbi:uncharacterized protein LOC144664816 [Oculina patagonica]
MSLSKVEQSVCRLSKSLPSGQGKVTLGSGCLVILKSAGADQSVESVYFITTTQVITKNDLLSESGHGNPITVEFLKRKGLLPIELNFNYKDAAENIPDPIPGRVLQDTESGTQQVSFIVIPVKKFDSRGWFMRNLWKPLEDTKRTIPCSHQSDENLQTAISNGQILCHVVCDDRKNCGFFIAEPSRLSFGKDTSEFVLSSASDSDCADHVYSIKDLPKEEKPKGAPLLNADGKFVGMLAVSCLEERKLYPVFLPNLDKDRPICPLNKDQRNSASANYALTSDKFTVKFDKPSGCSNEAPARQSNCQGNGNKDITSNNQTSNQPESENTAGEQTTTASAELQRSGNPALNLLQSDEFPESSLNDPKQQVVLPTLERDSGDGKSQQDLEEAVDDHQVSSETHDSSSTNPERDQLQDPNSLRVADQNSSHDQSSASSAAQSSESSQCEDEEGPSDVSEEDLVDAFDNQQENSESHDLSNNAEQGQPQNPNLPSNTGSSVSAPDSRREQSSESDQDEEFSSINVPAHDQQSQNPDLQRRPNLFPRQHSCRDELTGSTSLQDETDHRIPVKVSDATPKIFDETGFIERRAERNGQDQRPEADRVIQRTQSDLSNPAGVSQSDQVDFTPMARHYSSKKLEHVNPGSYVKEKIVSRASVMDALALHLDRSVSPGKRAVPLTQRWEHLADEYEVSDETKRKCYTGNLSPSEAMFNYLCTTNGSLKIGTLKEYLRQIGRKDVVTELKDGNLPDNATVADLCDKFPETLCNVCLKLDDKHNPTNWKNLGLKLGINGATLRSLEDPSDDSPTEVILQKIESLRPSLPIVEMKEVLMNLNLSTIAEELDNLPVGSTIQTLLDERDVLEKVSTLLDLFENSWFSFGRKFNIPRKELESLKPECPQSPTKLLMEYIVGKDPDLNMRSFLKSLANIKRFDVIKKLKEFFYAKDIDAILPVEGPPPQ